MVVDNQEQLVRDMTATKPNFKFLRNGFADVKGNAAKRKSAVELLQESKAYYVKSEKVLDAKQEFKHSEHLQVSANPNFDLLLKQSGTSKPGDVPTHPYGHTLPPSTRRSIPEFKLKAIERKLHELNTEHRRDHHHHSSNHHHHHNRVNHHGTAPALPPKSPRSLRIRSKTQTEAPQVTSTNGGKHHTEYRRSRSMPDKESLPRDDIQMKLRRLLQTDSKENLSGSIGSLHRLNVTNGELKTVKKGQSGKAPCPIPKKEPKNANISPKSDGATTDAAILQPRQQQEGNYSIHKSMPDLSPTKLGLSKHAVTGGRSVKSRVPRISRTARSSPTPSNGSCESETEDDDDGESVDGSLSVAPPKSVDLRRADSRATSDYVSRSPSCKCEYLTSTILTKEIQENGNDVEVLERKGSEKPTELTVLNSSNKVADMVMEMNNNNNNSKSSQNSPKTPVLIPSERRSGAPRVPPPPPPKRRSMAPPVTDGMRDADGDGNLDGSPRRRPILRSKSDISHRFSKSSDFVDTNRSYHGDEDLERFFSVMGLDVLVLQHISSPPSDMTSPVFFASTSSVDSIGRTRASHHSGDSDGSPEAARSGPAPTTVTTPSGAPPPSHMTSVTTPRENTGNGMPGLSNKDLAQHGHTETSIVERNARVIKWLYNCRKAKVDGSGIKS